MYHIAMWWWETDIVPESWKLASKSVDEVWAASRFVADGLRRALDVPVYHIPLGFELGPVRQRSIWAPTGSRRVLLYSSSSSI